MATDFAEIGEAKAPVTPSKRTPRQTELPQTIPALAPNSEASAATPLGGHANSDTHIVAAAQSPSDQGQLAAAILSSAALIGNLSMQCRRYEDLRRAHSRLVHQAKAACLFACDGDKVEAEKLYSKASVATTWLIPYFDAMDPLVGAISAQEGVIAKMARQLPVWPWAKDILGVSDRQLGLIVGECRIGPGEYRSPAALWKRMGMAVIDGGRQRRVKGDAAIEHGYVARRAAIMWNIGDSIIKAQVRNPKGPDKKPLGEPFAIGDLGRIYLDRKAYELGRSVPEMTPMWAHNRAKRYMAKRLLRDLWKAWRAQ